jgi:hypothetical protein
VNIFWRFLLIGIGIWIVVVFVGLLFVSRGQASELVNNPVDEPRAMEETPAEYGMEF